MPRLESYATPLDISRYSTRERATAWPGSSPVRSGETDHPVFSWRSPKSAEANEQLLARYIREVWDEGDLDALDRFLSPDFRRHVSPTLPPLDRQGQIERLKGFRSAFTDITLTVEDVVAGDDRVAFRSTIRGTHRGPVAGVAATDSQITVTLVDIVKIEVGLFAEQWGEPDMSDLFRQLESG